MRSGLNGASAAVARFVGAAPSDLFPVTNATAAVNTVVSSVINQYAIATQQQVVGRN
jgi:selenocysteine lyase/cysteine desulfurase